jgi:hypothetical protein
VENLRRIFFGKSIPRAGQFTILAGETEGRSYCRVFSRTANSIKRFLGSVQLQNIVRKKWGTPTYWGMVLI